jgi:hypothetical protein
MNRIVLLGVGIALILGVVIGVVLIGKKSGHNGEVPFGTTSPGPGQAESPTRPAENPTDNPTDHAGGASSSGAAGTSGGAVTTGANGKTTAAPGAPTAPSTGTGTGTGNGTGTVNGNSNGVATKLPGGTGEPVEGAGTLHVGGAPTVEGRIPTPDKIVPTNPTAKEPNDGVDGTGPQAGDDGIGAPVTKPIPSAPSLAGVKTPKVWLVAADLKKLSSAKNGTPFEVGNADGSKATPWKNREGSKLGDGVRAKGGTTATFVRDLKTSSGSYDVVAVCAPGAPNCVNSSASQIKLGVDINHPDSWVNGPDKTGKSGKGGSSFTALFVAARGSLSGNPIMENQNGEGGATKGPFLGWIGADLVGSIHGLQGIVGTNAAAIPSPWNDSITPEIYTLRFDRKKSELKLFRVGEKSSAMQIQAIEKGDGPDNDQYAAIAIGSQNPGKAAVTYVLEAATYSRALEDSEICAIHRDWNKRYSLKIPTGQLKPCL